VKNRNLNHSDNWETPEELKNSIYKEFDINFDPCPINFGDITPENDGLLIEWGERNFINPPYSRKLKEAFIMKAISQYKKGKLCVMLLPVSTSTKIFHDHILPCNPEIRFLKGRVKFKGFCENGEPAEGAGMHDSMLVIFDGSLERVA